MLSVISNLTSLINIWNNNIARLPEPAEGKEEDEDTADKHQEYLDLVNKMQKKIMKIKKLHSDVTRFETALEQHTISFVSHIKPIAVNDRPHQFTHD